MRYDTRKSRNLFRILYIILFSFSSGFVAFNAYKLIHSFPPDNHSTTPSHPSKAHCVANGEESSQSLNQIIILERKSNYLIKKKKGPSGQPNESRILDNETEQFYLKFRRTLRKRDWIFIIHNWNRDWQSQSHVIGYGSSSGGRATAGYMVFERISLWLENMWSLWVVFFLMKIIWKCYELLVFCEDLFVFDSFF